MGSGILVCWQYVKNDLWTEIMHCKESHFWPCYERPLKMLILGKLGKILDKFQPIWTFVTQVMIKILKALGFGQFVELLELLR